MPDFEFIGLILRKAVGRILLPETEDGQQDGGEGHHGEGADGRPPVIGWEGVVCLQLYKEIDTQRKHHE